jgi:ferredoxin
MKVVIDRNACAGHARCHELAPELVVLDDDGYIATDGFSVTAEAEELALRSARACPEQAIAIVSDDSNI